METNLLHRGDCAKVLTVQVPDESIDLIYVDPPFFSEKQYEVLWGNSYELRAFEDRWKGGVENYIAWIEPKIRECHRVLKKTGSLFLHCDWHAVAHLRLLLDEVFGGGNFLNEVAWCYRGGGVSERAFARKHDSILFYQRSSSRKRTFNVQYVPYSEASEKLVSGRGGVSIDGKERPLERGAHMPDWWTDVNSLQTWSPERLGYPTQKPEALLERIVSAASNPKEIVLDPMCGGGTTIAVAHKLGRRWVGIDISPTACKVTAKRMKKLGLAKVEIVGMPKTLKEVKELQPFDFQNWVCERLVARPSERKVANVGIDGRLFDGSPLEVKQSEGVGRNIVDNFETATKRVKKSRGIIVAFSFSKGAYEEAARAKNQEGLLIELKTVEEMLNED